MRNLHPSSEHMTITPTYGTAPSERIALLTETEGPIPPFSVPPGRRQHLDIFGVIRSIFLQVAGMLIEPLFDARVVIETTGRIRQPPASILFCSERILVLGLLLLLVVNLTTGAR